MPAIPINFKVTLKMPSGTNAVQIIKATSTQDARRQANALAKSLGGVLVHVLPMGR